MSAQAAAPADSDEPSDPDFPQLPQREQATTLPLTWFYQAIWQGDAKSVRTYLQREDAQVNRVLSLPNQNIDMVTPIMLAALKSTPAQVEIMSMLIDRGANVTCRAGRGRTTRYNFYTPLHFAAESGNVAALKLLIEHRPELLVEAETLQRNAVAHYLASKESALYPSPLALAVGAENMPVVEYLLSQGANPAAGERAVLPIAAGAQNDTNVMLRLLLAHPCYAAPGAVDKVDSKETDDMEAVTALSICLYRGNAEGARLLLDRGASMRRIVSFWSDHENIAPLETLKLFLAHGWSGDDAIEGAVYPRHGRLVDGLGKTVLPDAQLAPVVEMLLEHGAGQTTWLVLPPGKRLRGTTLIGDLMTGPYKYKQTMKLLMDFKPHEDEPARRLPTAVQICQVGPTRAVYLPSTHALQPITPLHFRLTTRALLMLHLRGSNPVDGEANNNDGMNAITWGAMPLEILEIVLEELYQLVRADRPTW